MPKKKLIKKHSVKANLQVVELTRAGSSLDLEIYADQEKIGTMIIGQGGTRILRVSHGRDARATFSAHSVEPVRGDDG
jgi:ribosomal protein S3